MFLARLAIKQPIFVTMVLLAITLVGVMSYMRMGVTLYPDMSNPMVSVSVSFPGASPQDVENLVTKPIESVMSGLNGVASISSTSREGMSMVMVNFVVGFDLQEGAQQVRESLDTIARRLPKDAGAPTLMRFDPNQSPFMTVALAIGGPELNPTELNQLLNEVIQPRLSRLTGVASVSWSGVPSESVRVELDARKLNAFRVSPSQVIAALQADNTVMPSGSMTSGNQDISLRTSAQFKNIEEIENAIVARRGNLAIPLNQVATVALKKQEMQSIVRVNGDNTLMLQVLKQSGSNVVATAGLVKEELQKLSGDFPTLKFTVVQDDSTFIQESDRDVSITLIIGALLAAAIVLLFFRNLRNTIITVIGLPIIVMGTFAAISYMGFTRNIITLMALSLSIGLLIDDAIVVRENIFRYMEHGASPKEAAEKATGEIAFAVLAISLTLVAVFIPVAFTSGQIGRLFKEFGITVALAVLVSLFEAFTFAPLLSAYFAKPLVLSHERVKRARIGIGERLENFWLSTAQGYRKILAWSLRFRWAVLVAAVALFGVSVWILTTFSMSFFPVTDSGQISIGINMPTGTTLADTDKISQDVERVILAQPEVERVYCRTFGNSGSISVQLKKGVQADPMIQRLRGLLPQYRNLIFSKPNQFMGVGMGMGGGTQVRGRPVQINIQGPVSLETLSGVADDVIDRLNTVPGLRDTDKSLPAQEPEIHVLVDRERTTDAGISAATLGQTIRGVFQGTTATTVDWGDRRMDVSVRMRPEDLSDPNVLLNLPITSPAGIVYPLSALARVEQGTGPTVLSRVDRQGQMTVGSNLEGRTTGQVTPDIRKAMEGITLPAGVTWKFGGQQAQTESAFSSLYFAMILGLVFVYMVLASQFGSLVHPLTVMAALPLAAIGSVLAMLAARTELTVISMIGLILMIGLAVKNSILLVDFIIRYRREGQERTAAILAAGPVRLRPILMTTLAIILGMAPTALGMGAAGSFRAPMAIAVIGGVFSSTLLSLVVVPVVYTYIDDIYDGVIRLFTGKPAARMKAAVHSPDADSPAEGDPETSLPGDSPPDSGR